MRFVIFIVLFVPFILFSESDFSYDSASNFRKKRFQNGDCLDLEYDPCNRPVKISATGSLPVHFKYDANGNCVEILDARGATKYSYDLLNRLINIEHPFLGSIGYSYTPQGKLNVILYPNGSVVRYVYDSSSRLSCVMSPQGVVRYFYHSGSNTLSRIILPTGSTTDFTYDSSRRVTSITHKISNGKLIQAFLYEYNSKGNILKAVSENPSQKKTTTYSYDKVDRLIAVVSPDGFEQFSYDFFGNRLSRKTTSGTVLYQYDRNNRVIRAGDVKFEYDEHGNLTKKISPNKTSIYVYDSKENLIEYRDDRNVVKYSYDAVGGRISKTLNGKTTFYINHVLTSRAQVLLEVDEEKWKNLIEL